MQDTTYLTSEQREALAAQPNGIVRTIDTETKKIYLIVEENRASELYELWLRDQLRVGFEQAECGDVAEWNVEEFLAKMHKQHVAAE